MGKWCLHASLFIFYQIIRKVAGNQDRHKSSFEFYFGPDQTTHFGVTCPWVTKISHFWTWISLKQLANPDQILCVASLGWGKGCIMFWGRLNLAHWTQVSDRCPLCYLYDFWNEICPWHIGLRPGAVAQSEASSLGMQAAPSSISTFGTFYRADLVMKTFLRPFSLFCWFKKNSCQLLAKECALSTGKLPRRLAQEQVARLTYSTWNDLKCVEGL